VPSLHYTQPPARTFYSTAVLWKTSHADCCTTLTNRPLRPREGRFVRVVRQLACEVFARTAVLQSSRFWPIRTRTTYSPHNFWLVERSYPAGWMAVVHLFCTVVLVGIGQNWGDCNKENRSLRPLRLPFRQVQKTYARATASAPVNPPSLTRKHRTCPHVSF